MSTQFLSNEELFLLIQDIIRTHQQQTSIILHEFFQLNNVSRRSSSSNPRRLFSRLDRIPTQVKRLNRLVGVTARSCLDNLRMDRNCFGRLCILFRERAGLEDGAFVKVEEQVVIFLCVLAHHKKTG